MGKDIKTWGIGEGRLPVTSDPENTQKFFATYEKSDDAEAKRKDAQTTETEWDDCPFCKGVPG